MTTEITYAEVRFKSEPKTAGAPSQAPAALEQKTRPPQSDSGFPKLLLAALLILLLLILTVSFLIAFIIFFQKYSKLVQEEKFTQELTHTMLECRKQNFSMKGRSWSCCPKDWKSFGSSCYFFPLVLKNWTDSKKHCEGLQAHLLVVDTKEEQDFINKLVRRENAYYLGLSDLKNGHWEWVDETPYNHSATFWHRGEPSHANEHCVTLNFRSGGGWGWNDIPCFLSQQSICEMLPIYLSMEHSS